MGLQGDIEWAVSTLSAATRENGYDVCQTVLERLRCHVTPAAQKTGGSSKLKKRFEIASSYQTAFEDEETDLVLYADQLEKIIEGLLDGPIHTPVKKRPTQEDTVEIDESSTQEEIQFTVPELPSTESDGSVPRQDIEEYRTSLANRYSQQKVVDLREVCKQQQLDTKGKKKELVDRIVDKTINMEYGSPRMRNSYQTAMNTPLPITQPKSLRSNTSSTTSLTSINSNGSLRPTRATKNPSFKSSTKAVPKTRLRSPSPNSGPSSLPKTPSFKSRMREGIQTGSLASPRPWSKTPSKTNLMERCKTPSRLEIEQREAERERKIKEKKLLKEQEAQRKREEKAAHAEDIRRKKQMMEQEKKQKGKEKIFSLKKSEKTKKTKLKDMRSQLAEKMKIDSEREKQDKMKAEQMERARREEERRKQLEQEEKLAEMKAQAEKQMQLTPAKNLTQTHTGYEMTPQGEDKWALHPSSAENYNIEDLDSGDETDDDERPRKKIPAWAVMKSSAFRSAILRQYKERSINPMEIFEDINPNRDWSLTELFEHMASMSAMRRYKKPRNSSAKWTTMVQPRELVDRTLNLDQSVYPLIE